MQGTAETFLCVQCGETLPADKLAFDTDPEHRLGVCTGCDEAIQAAEALPAWMSREVA
jgi:NAD-dependent SIR2 family protein deacetylase